MNRRTLPCFILALTAAGSSLATEPEFPQAEAPRSETAAASADESPLGEYVPAGVHFYASWRTDEALNELYRPLEEAWKRLFASGIGEDIFELATIELGGDERRMVRAETDKAIRLLRSVDWASLFEREVALAFQLEMPIPQYALLSRVAGDGAGARYGELEALFKAVTEYAPDFLFTTSSERLGAQLTTLSTDQFPVALCAARKGDVVLLTTSEDLLDSILGRMDADSAQGSIVQDERFLAGKKQLPAPGFAESWFDSAGYFRFLEKNVLGTAEAFLQEDEDALRGVGLARRIFEELGRLDHFVGIQRAVESGQVLDAALGFSQDAGQAGWLEQAIAEQKPIGPAIRAVPADAIGFFLGSGVRPTRIYDTVIDVLREIPDGESVLEEWADVQEHLGVDVREDCLAWLDGGFGSITLPSAETCGVPEQVFFFRLADKDQAEDVLGKAWKPVSRYIESRGHQVRAHSVDGLDSSFRRIEISGLPWFEPVIGTPGDVLVLATSIDAARRVAASVTGQAPAFVDSERGQRLGDLSEELYEAWYCDVEGELEALGNVLSTAGFVLSLLPRDHDTRPLLPLGRAMSKLGVFLRDIDIAVDWSGWTRYDAASHRLFSRQLTRFGESDAKARAKEPPRDF